MVRIAIAVVIGGVLGASAWCHWVHPSFGSSVALVVLPSLLLSFLVATKDTWMLRDEQYFAYALKQRQGSEKRTRWLRAAANVASVANRKTFGSLRARHLLLLAKVRREQGLLPEAAETADLGYRLGSDGIYKLELTYWAALTAHEAGDDAKAVELLQGLVAVPLQDLTAFDRKTQQLGCDLLLKLLPAPEAVSVKRRGDLLRAGY